MSLSPCELFNNLYKRQISGKALHKEIIDILISKCFIFGHDEYNIRLYLENSIALIENNLLKSTHQMRKFKISHDAAIKVGFKEYKKFHKDDSQRVVFEALMVVLFYFHREIKPIAFNSITEFLEKYPEFKKGGEIDDAEIDKLYHFANFLSYCIALDNPYKPCLGHLTTISVKLTEGFNKAYVSGTGETKATKRRKDIFYKESAKITNLCNNIVKTIKNIDNSNSTIPTALVEIISNFSNDRGEYSKIQTGSLSFQHPTEKNIYVDATESVNIHPNGSMIRAISILKQDSSYGSTRGKITKKKNVSISITNFDKASDINEIDLRDLKSHFPHGFTSSLEESKDNYGRLIRGTSIHWSSSGESEVLDNINYSKLFSIELEKKANNDGEIKPILSRIASIERSSSLMSLESFPSLLSTQSWRQLLSTVPDESELNDNKEEETNNFDFLFADEPKKLKIKNGNSNSSNKKMKL